MLSFLGLWMVWFAPHYANGQPVRIVSLSGALSETVDALGLGNRLVAVDVTSEYPAYVKKLPRVSQDRTVPLEGLVAFRPDLVLAPNGDLAPDVERRLKQLGIKLVTFQQEYSINGALRFIREVAAALGVPEKGNTLSDQLKGNLEKALEERTIPQKKSKGIIYLCPRRRVDECCREGQFHRCHYRARRWPQCHSGIFGFQTVQHGGIGQSQSRRHPAF